MQPWKSELVHERTVIMGGGSGIGQATALELATLGGTVYVLGRRATALEETVARASSRSGRVIALQCDARDPKLVDEAFDRMEQDGGPVQALVHSAASVQYVPARQLTPDSFREVVDSVLFGAFNTIHRWAAPLLNGQHPGVAVALTSAFASRGSPNIAHSSSGKAGIEALVKTLAREWGPAGLRLNVIGPGFFPVDRTRAMFEPGQPGAHIVDMIALQRLGTIEEVVGPIVFLLTRAASYITGQVLIPDGGFRLTPQVIPRWNF
jgi:NAD(P)-dependent dehydrogenase (short-subunit alcohol dehydrogenase family)